MSADHATSSLHCNFMHGFTCEEYAREDEVRELALVSVEGKCIPGKQRGVSTKCDGKSLQHQAIMRVPRQWVS